MTKNIREREISLDKHSRKLWNFTRRGESWL